MGRHVIETLRPVHIAAMARREPVERRHEVCADIRVGVLLDRKGSRGVSAEGDEQPVAKPGARRPLRHGVRDLGETRAAGLDHQPAGRLPRHGAVVQVVDLHDRSSSSG
jgi:hypothetical protein